MAQIAIVIAEWATGRPAAAAWGTTRVYAVGMRDEKIRVLFVCTHNSARSQIAEALLGRDGGGAFDASSAGTEVTRVHPLAERVLAEVGIDWSGARSKALTEFLDQPFDYVITVCDSAREACPFFPGARRTLHWSLDDPSQAEGTDAERLEAFRATRGEVGRRVQALIAEATTIA